MVVNEINLVGHNAGKGHLGATFDPLSSLLVALGSLLDIGSLISKDKIKFLGISRTSPFGVGTSMAGRSSFIALGRELEIYIDIGQYLPYCIRH